MPAKKGNPDEALERVNTKIKQRNPGQYTASNKAARAVQYLADHPTASRREAMLAAGYSERTAAKPTQNFTERPTVQALAAELRVELQQRIGVAGIVKKINEQMEAEKWYISQTGPDFKDADYQARAKGIDLALKALTLGETSSTTPTTNIQVNIKPTNYTD